MNLDQVTRDHPVSPALTLFKEIPVNEYYEYFGPDYELDVKSSNAEDMNTPAYLDRVKRIVMENLRHTGGPPSVQMSGTQVNHADICITNHLFADIPSIPIDSALDDPNRDEELISADERRPRRLLDSRRQADGNLSDSDDEGEGGRRNHARHRDHDSTSRSSGNESGGGRKFGMGVGIMNTGQTTSSHLGAGPSGHTTVERILSATHYAHPPMDVDDSPSTSENGNVPFEGEKTADAAGDMNESVADAHS